MNGKAKTYKMSMNFSYLVVGLIIFYIVLLVKSKTVADFSVDPLLYSYAMFVIIFLLFRIGGAVLYRGTYLKVLDHEDVGLLYPHVTFIIPCKNEEKDIHKTVSKCFDAEYPKELIEVIVINDGSTDRTCEILKKLKEEKFPNLNIIDWKENRGKREAMVAGFRLAKGSIVIQLDSDSYIEPSSFKKLIAPFANRQIAAVCAHADPENADYNFITKMQAAYYFVSFRIMKAAESSFYTVFCCSGCSSAYRKSAVMPVLDNWLNESFLGKKVTYGDDRALTSWLLKSGHKTVYSEDVQAYTIVPEKFRQLLTQQLRWKKSWIINSIFTSSFIFKKQPFVAVFYFYPLVLISYLAPLMGLHSLIYIPIRNSVTPFFYIFGIFIITAMVIFMAKMYSGSRKYLGYFFVWQGLNMVLFLYIIFYAAIRINDRGWGTR
jgi:hyaluronan synthase